MSKLKSVIPLDADWRQGDLALARKYGVTRQCVNQQRRKRGKRGPKVKWEYQKTK